MKNCTACIFSSDFDRDGYPLQEGEHICILSGEFVGDDDTCDDYDTDQLPDDEMAILSESPYPPTDEDVFWDFSAIDEPLPWEKEGDQ